MKKILALLLVSLLSVSWVFANYSKYSYYSLDSEISAYKIVIEFRLWDTLQKFSEKDYEDLYILVDWYENKYLNDSNISEELKIKNISILKAFKLIAMEWLHFEEDYFFDMEYSLNKASETLGNVDIFELNIGMIEWRIDIFEERNLFKNRTRTLKMQIARLKESFEEVQLIKNSGAK